RVCCFFPHFFVVEILIWKKRMISISRYARCFMMTAVAVACTIAPAAAQTEFPSKPIRLIVPFPPGGGTDILSRVVGQELSEYLTTPVLVENKPGGNTLIAANFVAAAKPDGYTLFTSIDSTMVMNQFLYKKLSYDPMKDFTPV